MRFANVRELKNKTSEILRSAEKETVVITSKGKPRAMVIAVSEDDFGDYLLEQSPRLLKTLEDAKKSYEKEGGIRIGDYLAKRKLKGRG